MYVENNKAEGTGKSFIKPEILNYFGQEPLLAGIIALLPRTSDDKDWIPYDLYIKRICKRSLVNKLGKFLNVIKSFSIQRAPEETVDAEVHANVVPASENIIAAGEAASNAASTTAMSSQHPPNKPDDQTSLQGTILHKYYTVYCCS